MDGDGPVMPGVSVVRTGGHTMHHQVVYRRVGRPDGGVRRGSHSDDGAHRQRVGDGIRPAPMETLAFKRAFIREAIDREYLIFFEHDPEVAAGFIREANGRRHVEAVAVA